MQNALSHDQDKGGAPAIVASGRDAAAQQILDLAFADGVRVREDQSLADILKVLESASDVPVLPYAAVAEILTHLYRVQVAAAGLDGGAGAPSSHHQGGLRR